MTQQFHEGEEVEVVQPISHPVEGYPGTYWRKAKIVRQSPAGLYHVQFHDGTCAVANAAYIAAIQKGAFPSGITRPLEAGTYRAFNKDQETP